MRVPIHRFNEGQKAYLSYQLRDASGRIILRAHDAPAAPYDQTATPGFKTIGDYRLFSDTDNTTGLTITVAETTKGRWEASWGARAMLWSLAGLVPLNILAIWLIVRGPCRRCWRLSATLPSAAVITCPLDISDQPWRIAADRGGGSPAHRAPAALRSTRARFRGQQRTRAADPIAGAPPNAAADRRARGPQGSPPRPRRRGDAETALRALRKAHAALRNRRRVAAAMRTSTSSPSRSGSRRLRQAARGSRAPDLCEAEGAKLGARMDMDRLRHRRPQSHRQCRQSRNSHGTIEVRVDPGGMIRVINDGPAIAPEVLVGLKRRFGPRRNPPRRRGPRLAIVETIMNRSMGSSELFSPALGRHDGSRRG